MKVPTVADAHELLRQAEQMNPGPWLAHSTSTAENAKRIAKKSEDMDPETAFVLGLLHDIGRREGPSHIQHIFDGYTYLMNLGFEDAAGICLTHSFPLKDASTFVGQLDCTQEELLFLQHYLDHTEYTDYDRLIQLCDAISMPQGAVLMEKRLVDVATRHGLPDFTLKKWQAFFEAKQYFDQKVRGNIYDLLPNIIENTFA